VLGNVSAKIPDRPNQVTRIVPCVQLTISFNAGIVLFHRDFSSNWQHIFSLHSRRVLLMAKMCTRKLIED
jgi:hypothetical protein